MNQTGSICNEQPQISVFQAFSLGFKVILSEIHWNIIRGLRNWEIKQLQKKLNKEYQAMGKISLEQDSSEEEKVNLSKNQIDFLEKELNFLRSDLQKVRADLVKKRREKWQI